MRNADLVGDRLAEAFETTPLAMVVRFGLGLISQNASMNAFREKVI